MYRCKSKITYKNNSLIIRKITKLIFETIDKHHLIQIIKQNFPKNIDIINWK